MMRIRVAVVVVCLLAAFLPHSVTSGQEAAGEGRTTVLDGRGLWRFHHVMTPPRIEMADGTKPIAIGTRWLDLPTEPAPESWTAPDLDDSQWLHGPAGMTCDSPYTSRIQARGAFRVADPVQVRDLRVSVVYHGGAIVTLNGHRVALGHLAAADAALAEPYPKGAFTNAEGELLDYATLRATSREARGAIEESRRRRLADVALPPEHLREGVNVLCVEVVAAPYHAVVEEQKLTTVSEVEARGTAYDLSWATCRLLDASLTAADTRGLATDDGGGALRVWNSSPLVSDPTNAAPAAGLPLRPVRILTPRNGAASGVVVVAGEAGRLKQLTAKPGRLVGPDGAAIAPSRVRVRFVARWGAAGGGRTWIPREPDMLLDAPPDDIPDNCLAVWITVAAPADAAPGQYTGTVALAAGTAGPVAVPLAVTVAPWAYPDSAQRQTWIELMQCPDAPAMEYEVELWSDEHWKLIDRSFELMGAIGSRTVYLPLICRTNMGNAESMVRWIDRGEGKPMQPDFSIVERYLDTALKHIKEPAIVGLYVWDVYLRKAGSAPAVTAVRPDGKREMVRVARVETPEGKALWKPVFDGLRQRLRQRGIEDKAMLAMLSDWWASKAEVAALKEILGDVPWVKHSHPGRLGYGTTRVHGLVPLAYEANVWNLQFNPDPVNQPTYGWRRDVLVAEFDRFGFWNNWPAGSMRHIPEFNVTGHQRGVGRIGADYWPTIRDRNGRRTGRPVERYPEVHWHNTNVYSMLLAPGPDGAVASVRYERLREGLQECEARIAVERVLVEDASRALLDEKTIARCREVLDERSVAMWKAASDMNLSARRAPYMATSANKKASTFSRHVGGETGHRWFISTDWQRRASELYRLASELAPATAD